MFRKLTVTFTPDERAALDHLAAQDVRPVKDQVRALIRDEAKKRGLWPLPAGSTPSAADRARGAVTP